VNVCSIIAGEYAESIRDAATDRELRSLAVYSHHVVGMAFSPDGTRLAAAGGDDLGSSKGSGTKLWDLANGQEVLSLGGSTDVITRIAFSPGGEQLLAARQQGALMGGMWGTSSGELVIWTASGPDSAAKLLSPRCRHDRVRRYLASVVDNPVIERSPRPTK
jgi:WD40 repeat protein